MKKFIMIMMAVLISTVSFSKGRKDDNLKVSGSYLFKTNVKFEVAIVNDDASKVVVQTKSSTFTYKIKLKLGNRYVITFTKGNITKKLFVTADKPGYMEIDVDFETDNAAQLCYNATNNNYDLTLLYSQE